MVPLPVLGMGVRTVPLIGGLVSSPPGADLGVQAGGVCGRRGFLYVGHHAGTAHAVLGGGTHTPLPIGEETKAQDG